MAQSKKSKTLSIMVGTTSIDVDTEVTDDLEFLELLVELDSGNNLASISLLKKLFGNQYETVKAALRNSDGVVKTTDMGEVFFETLRQIQKNS